MVFLSEISSTDQMMNEWLSPDDLLVDEGRTAQESQNNQLIKLIKLTETWKENTVL